MKGFKKKRLWSSGYSKPIEINSSFLITPVCIKVCGVVSQMRKITVVESFLINNSSALGFHQEHKEIHVHLGKCLFFGILWRNYINWTMKKNLKRVLGYLNIYLDMLVTTSVMVSKVQASSTSRFKSQH